jgi:hypothetical protein
MKHPGLLLAFALVALPAGVSAQTSAVTQPVAATAPAAALKASLAGMYDVTFANGSGQQFGGRLVIKDTADNYEGTIAPDGMEAFAFPRLVFERDSAVFKIGPPAAPGEIIFHLKFDGPSFSGRYEGVENGQITGKKIR